MYLVHRKDLEKAEHAIVHVQGQDDWIDFLAFYQDAFGDRDVLKGEFFPDQVPDGLPDFEAYRQKMLKSDVINVMVSPRGVGRTIWHQSERKQVQHQRRFYLLGESLGGMQVWDVRRALQAIRTIDTAAGATIMIGGYDHSAALVMYASLFEDVTTIGMTRMAESDIESLPLLNVSRFFNVDQIVAAAASRQRVILNQIPADAFEFTRKTAEIQGWDKSRFIFLPDEAEE